MIPKFNKLLSGLQKYCNEKSNIPSKFFIEISFRLNQLDFLRSKIKYYEKKYDVRSKHHTLALRTYSESYYFISFRIIEIFQKVFKVSSIRNKSKGITLVRNLLIQHKNSFDSSLWSFGWSSDKGSMFNQSKLIKQNSSSHTQTQRDPGLYQSVNEFYKAIEDELKLGEEN